MRSSHRRAARALPALLLLALAAPLASAGAPQEQGRQDEELERLLSEERRDADRLRRRGEHAAALRILGGHLADDPEDALSRAFAARVRFDRAEHQRALIDAERAFQTALAGSELATQRAAGAILSEVLLLLGRAEDAEAVLERARAAFTPASDPRDAWLLGRVLEARGRREEALRTFAAGADGPRVLDWEAGLARARCERRLGRIEAAGRSLIEADRAARAGEGVEPDVLVELGDLFYEADKEVAEGASRSPRRLYDEALSLAPAHEGALLGLLVLHRTNWRRTAYTPGELLARVLGERPDSIRALLAAATIDLEDGELRGMRLRLARLEELAPRRREVRTLRAALAWVEHERERCEELLAELVREDPADGRPEREVGRHLVELYRFAEGAPFLERAVERDPSDHEAWTQLGRALAGTGDEPRALEALKRAKREAGLRQDAWRNNTTLVLERMARELVAETFGELTFVWRPDAAAVLATYFVPFYREAREELAARYGYTPGHVRIELFRRHQDFSVRSTGFEGFPALGVCFGPVVTTLSPLAEMRGQFSWARTAFHEFTHVIHLGLSHNRCPRWITEGLATWEEARANPAWDRNMRRELVDAYASGEIIPVRELNRAFRGPRILFGYYQGGLVCELLIGRFGFPSMVRLLEAFDRGLDVDQALGEVFGITPEELDRDLLRFVEERTRSLAIEPRWSPEALARVRLALPRELPSDEAGRAAWVRGFGTLAVGAWQQGRRVDAEQALRELRRAGEEPARALFLRAEMALSSGDREGALELYQRGFAQGGEEFRARVALAGLLWQGGDLEGAEQHLLAAERAFPGYEEAGLSAELKLSALYAQQKRTEDSLRALERRLAYDAGDFGGRMRLAAWYVERGEPSRACELYREACEIDPFVRRLHVEWAEALIGLERHEEALREYGVALLTPPELDLEQPGPLSAAERARLIARQALCLLRLERLEEARAKAAEALALDPECEGARQALELLGS